MAAEARDSRRRMTVGSAFDDRWKMEKILGEGAFSAVYEVSDITRPGKLFALKFESDAPPEPGDPPKVLPLEVTVLRALRNNNAKYYPGYESCGQNERFNYVVMGLVGKNVNEVCTSADAEQKIQPLKWSPRWNKKLAQSTGNSRNAVCFRYLHRDLKPANMCIGRPPDDLRSVYILDWDLCRRYVNGQGKIHRPHARAAFRGTPRYASANALSDTDQGRVHDMWSWFFTIVELTVGRLPWDGERGPTNQEYLNWLGAKKNACVYDPNIMCAECPSGYRDLYNCILPLNYSDKPDYEICRTILNDTMTKRKYKESEPLDWEPAEADLAKLANDIPNATMMPMEQPKQGSSV